MHHLMLKIQVAGIEFAAKRCEEGCMRWGEGVGGGGRGEAEMRGRGGGGGKGLRGELNGGWDGLGCPHGGSGACVLFELSGAEL